MVASFGLAGGNTPGRGAHGLAGETAIGRRRRRVLDPDQGSPILELNTTPLIDVMLVLLVMLIITIPTQTHKVGLDLPGIVEFPRPDPLRNKLTIASDGTARWNGQAVGDAALKSLFGEVAAMERPAEIHFEPDAAARYERVDGVLAMASRSGVGTLGFVGNHRYRSSF